MKKNGLIEFLQRQIEYLQGQLDEALSSVNSLTLSNEKLQSTNDRLVATVDELRKQIASLEDAVKGKGAELSKEKLLVRPCSVCKARRRSARQNRCRLLPYQKLRNRGHRRNAPTMEPGERPIPSAR